MLGICGGAQAINVVLGGSLYQDITMQVPTAPGNINKAKTRLRRPSSDDCRGTRLRAIVGRSSLRSTPRIIKRSNSPAKDWSSTRSRTTG